MRIQEIDDSIFEELFDSILTAATKTAAYFDEDITDNWWYSFKYIRNYSKKVQPYADYQVTTNETLATLGTIIGQDCDEKWSRLLSLYYAEYEALQDYSVSESYTGGHDLDSSETDKYKSELEGNRTTSNSMYGFNSSTAVPTDTSDTDYDETETRSVSDNAHTRIDDYDETYSKTRSGHMAPISDLYLKEWRARQNLVIEVIMQDISEYLCINVY